MWGCRLGNVMMQRDCVGLLLRLGRHEMILISFRFDEVDQSQFADSPFKSVRRVCTLQRGNRLISSFYDIVLLSFER